MDFEEARLLTKPQIPVRRGFFYNPGVLKLAAATAQTELEMVTLDQLVPRDHLLRLIDTHIRFDFIREKTEELYCANNGRPAIDPVVLFKMLFVGYLFGVRSERRLVREIEVSVGRDLQFIRLNGTVVGGLIGLALYAITHLFA